MALNRSDNSEDLNLPRTSTTRLKLRSVTTVDLEAREYSRSKTR